MSERGEILEGKYALIEPIGSGASGKVYLAENVRIRKRVAIKVLDLGAAAQLVQRFEKEARAAGRIGSEHIVEVFDIGTTSRGQRFIVMEYLEGETLAERLNRVQKLMPHEAVDMLLQVLNGLGAAHAGGLVHRDLKPENIFLVRQRAGHRDFVKIIDFGISKLREGDVEDELTRTGAFLGTPQYMSPEQVRSSKDVDARSDIYSVGVLLYHCLTGRTPLQEASLVELLPRMMKQAFEHPRKYSEHIDDVLAQILFKALSPLPGDRFQSANEFHRSFEKWRATQTVDEGTDNPSSELPTRIMNSERIAAIRNDLAAPLPVVDATRVAGNAPPQSTHSSASQKHSDNGPWPKKPTKDSSLWFMFVPIAVLLLGCFAALVFVLTRGGTLNRDSNLPARIPVQSSEGSTARPR